ncbi:tRNA glutamyl-Q(34) synthetase GluQRS [Fontimonas sp. SYSU GA230001]|uniref:tRNA glutamyl-Q(34) synthetase GluQRS n=1 Tax=Fontimonas sp. SYSU GA230001 TaxID=3142450 RepID=UPI0032B5331B
MIHLADLPDISSSPAPTYRGRFAPTPSGPLHLGSLLTALASWLQARAHNGRWLLRIDDLDRERCRPGMADVILRQLEAHGLHWDDPPRYQTQHLDAYRDALAQLRATGALYACGCSRARLKAESRPGPEGPIYCGRCRNRALPEQNRALRLRVGNETMAFDDGWQGTQRCVLARDIGDFVVWRRDGLPAYQLACAVDESAQGITEVVRGCDLLGSTFMQRYVMDRLRLHGPAYRHLPLLMAADGRKLSKQNHAPPIDAASAGRNLLRCLQALRQHPPAALHGADVAEILAWAAAHWNPDRVPAQHGVQVEPWA